MVKRRCNIKKYDKIKSMFVHGGFYENRIKKHRNYKTF